MTFMPRSSGNAGGIIQGINGQSDTLGQIPILQSNADAEGSGDGYISFLTTTSGTAGLREQMRITNSGKASIGTTTPTEKLTVSGNLTVSSLPTLQRTFSKSVEMSKEQNSFAHTGAGTISFVCV
ncbi:MAG: hypothetical protein HYT73_04960 [Candidatus Aenigmarchaeota archaeon]|nr:hypothetical protein [Candidatus Aenigmarchaeota archaeon]